MKISICDWCLADKVIKPTAIKLGKLHCCSEHKIEAKEFQKKYGDDWDLQVMLFQNELVPIINKIIKEK